ncbi:MAG: ATPase, central domain protein [Thermoleophilia bacterium]|nr:ATPase, central domain protein [Thermoleophilia bacterium]
MARADQIKALVESHFSGDEQRFQATAIQVAASAARQGHTRFARELRALIDAAEENASQRSFKPVPVVQPRGELSGLMAVTYPKTRFRDMVLDKELGGRLERVLVEQRQNDKLRSHGLEPRRKLLFKGAPGNGKTMTAHALAGELKLPLFSIQLDGLITKYLGETAAKLRLIFDAIAGTRAVYLFDEFDAIGARRDTGGDVGEIRRVLNTFLQFLEQDDSDSLVIGATNYADLLDDALFRRFDDVIEFSMPDDTLVRRIIEERLAGFTLRQTGWSGVTKSARGLSFAEIVHASEDAAKEALLSGTVSVSTTQLTRALSVRRETRPQS